MLSADSTTPQAAAQALYDSEDDDGHAAVSLTDVLIWLGEKKALIGAVTPRRRRSLGRRRAAAAADLHGANDVPRARLAAAERLGGGARRARLARWACRRLGAKTPDDLYVALLKSDSVQRGLDQRFNLQGALRRRHLRGAAQGAAQLRSRHRRQEERRDQRRGRRQGREVRRRPRQRARARGDQAARPPRGLGGPAASRVLREAAAGHQGEPGQGRAVAAGGAGEVGRHRPRQAGRGVDHRMPRCCARRSASAKCS